MNMKSILLSVNASIFIILLSTALAADLPSNEKNGYIEGNVGYPSEGVPSDMKIYAENISTGKTYVTLLSDLNDPNTFTEETKYSIKVPVGSYYVYSMTSHVKGRENYRAYYSEAVTCGLKVKCQSHKPIKVSVKASRTTSNIDPLDWYDSQSQLRRNW